MSGAPLLLYFNCPFDRNKTQKIASKQLSSRGHAWWMSVIQGDRKHDNKAATNANEVSLPVVSITLPMGGPVRAVGGRTARLLAMQIALTVSRRFRLELDSCHKSRPRSSLSSSSLTSSHGTILPALTPKSLDICIYIALRGRPAAATATTVTD